MWQSIRLNQNVLVSSFFLRYCPERVHVDHRRNREIDSTSLQTAANEIRRFMRENPPEMAFCDFTTRLRWYIHFSDNHFVVDAVLGSEGIKGLTKVCVIFVLASQLFREQMKCLCKVQHSA